MKILSQSPASQPEQPARGDYYLTPDLSHISAAGASPDAARLDPLLDRGNNDRTMDAQPRDAGENLVASRGDSTLILTPDP